MGFNLGFNRQWNMDSHLVAIKVSIEGGTDQRMDLNSLTFY